MIAVDVLNRSLRSFLAKWHPLLLDWEAKRGADRSPAQHESEWPEAGALRRDLQEVQKVMVEYADLLGQAAGVPSLILKQREQAR